MVPVTYSRLIPLNQFIKPLRKRYISKYIHRDISSKAIRQRFLDYFIDEHDHSFVKSSPVIPYCDPSVAFVNAGMNQFKGIFLGTESPQYEKVTNSQKCVRVGGKHNDLNMVGNDGYHHTFFEMLGNWSFGDYFKREACNMAWDLLTNVYKLPKSRLYVTYFKGDANLGIGADVETKEIWKQLGIPEERILPFGMEENFWEMGLTGPCGPCTEIHIDHLGTINRSEFVNKGLHDLTEIWNIVFIEYNRQSDGTISTLPNKHVDTGMGFERLTSIMQGKISNYDTDNFTYLLNAIHKNSSGVPRYEGKFGESDWNHLDTSYRIMADHTRMITACLADGIIPEQNQKLRRILRKTFLLSETVFKNNKGLVKELTNYVVEHLGPVYPEMERNISQIHQIINYEEEVYNSLRQTAAKEWAKFTKGNPKLSDIDILENPNFIGAYKEIVKISPKEVDSKLAFKLYDTFGLDEDSIIKISKVLNLKFDPEDLNKELEIAKIKSKKGNFHFKNEIYSSLVNENIPKTEDKMKYSYFKRGNKYIFYDLEVKVLKIFQEETAIPEIDSECYCSLLLDRTNLYSEAGGQVSDQGTINFGNDSFEISSLENINGYILHKGYFRSNTNKLKTNAVGVLSVDEEFRLNCMRNHTSVHLLNSALKKMKGVTCQKSSKVTDRYLYFEVAVFGPKLNLDEVLKIESHILKLIENGQPVHTIEVDSRKLLSYDFVTLIPGEIYPDDRIRIIEMEDNGFVSREPCCGTHVLNTADIEDFCIIGLKSLGRSTSSVTAVTGDRAKLARENGNQFYEEIFAFSKDYPFDLEEPEPLYKTITHFRRRLNFDMGDESILPVDIKYKCKVKLEEIYNRIKEATRERLRDFTLDEMHDVLESHVKTTKSNQRYIVYFLRSSVVTQSVSLKNATSMCPDLPVLLISFQMSKIIQARCCVPKELRTDKFNAEKWLKSTVADPLECRVAPPKGYDRTLVCDMKAKPMSELTIEVLLDDILDNAQRYVEENL